MNGSEGSLPSAKRPNTFRNNLLTVLGKLVVWRRSHYATGSSSLSQSEILRGLLSIRKYSRLEEEQEEEDETKNMGGREGEGREEGLFCFGLNFSRFENNQTKLMS